MCKEPITGDQVKEMVERAERVCVEFGDMILEVNKASVIREAEKLAKRGFTIEFGLCSYTKMVLYIKE